MRYLSHQFSHWETLARARSWLDLLGFDPSQIEVNPAGLPRLTLRVAPEQVHEVRQLLDAAESSDPDGWPSFWNVPAVSQLSARPAAQSGRAGRNPAHTEIGWHPIDRGRIVSPELVERWDASRYA